MKRKLWLRQLSVSSPSMTVKSQLPLRYRLLVWLIALCVVIGIGLWAYDMGRSGAGLDADVRDQHVQITQLKAERDQLAKSANAAESRLNIELAAQNQMSEQIKTLEAENARLKEENAYYESLLPSNTGAQGVTIQRLALEPVSPDKLRYRLLVLQGGSGKQRFAGELQLVVTFEQNGQTQSLTFPNDQSGDHEKFKIGFRHYQRLEGVLTLPAGAKAKTVQARVLEKGKVKVESSAGI